MNAPDIRATTPLDAAPVGDPRAIARELAAGFAATAARRDEAGGNPKAERDALRASGLLALVIPTEFGGAGADWRTALDTVREIARADSSLAHVYGFQHLLLATVRLFGRPDQWQPWFEQTAARRWFWGNALNPLDTRTVATRVEGGREFTGRKSFCSGATDADMLVVSALQADDRRLVIGVVPGQRAGIELLDDWDNMGQRQTDSGSAVFDRLQVAEDELLLQPGPLSTPFACLRPLIAQLVFCNVFLGQAEGAVAAARGYTREQTRLWPGSPGSSVTDDPYILRHYGEYWAALEAARVLTDRAADRLDAAWARGDALTEAERGEVALAVATAKVTTTRTGLELTSRIFEVAGARATTAALRLDRFWRNVRVQTLHDPLDMKLRELGDWALNDHYPKPSFYS
ncbi:acyl-CoA dehydrogenase family protein [Derxia lacustris]|uniref:acyl-CoA dehydrogenase family protein n=1 Tax=Derxia lacustris TaxID=764842 RepID=UPI000A176ACF|nr:acyl-CoA dehydrogenase family protein [Derxia lacustris]